MMLRRVMGCAAALGAFFALAGCNMQPVYSTTSGAAAASGLREVSVPAIPGQAGWLVRNALVDRIGAAGATVGSPRYRLDVRLDDSLEGLGLINDDTITRERRQLRARYQLIDTTTGEVLLDASDGSDAGIDVVSSDYATIAAEQTALENLSRTLADQMVMRVSLALRNRQ